MEMNYPRVQYDANSSFSGGVWAVGGIQFLFTEFHVIKQKCSTETLSVGGMLQKFVCQQLSSFYRFN